MKKKLAREGLDIDCSSMGQNSFSLYCSDDSTFKKIFGLAFSCEALIECDEPGIANITVTGDWLEQNFLAIILGFVLFVPWITALIGFLGYEKKTKRILGLVCSAFSSREETVNPCSNQWSR